MYSRDHSRAQCDAADVAADAVLSTLRANGYVVLDEENVLVCPDGTELAVEFHLPFHPVGTEVEFERKSAKRVGKVTRRAGRHGTVEYRLNNGNLESVTRAQIITPITPTGGTT